MSSSLLGGGHDNKIAHKVRFTLKRAHNVGVGSVPDPTLKGPHIDNHDEGTGISRTSNDTDIDREFIINPNKKRPCQEKDVIHHSGVPRVAAEIADFITCNHKRDKLSLPNIDLNLFESVVDRLINVDSKLDYEWLKMLKETINNKIMDNKHKEVNAIVEMIDNWRRYEKSK